MIFLMRWMTILYTLCRQENNFKNCVRGLLKFGNLFKNFPKPFLLFKCCCFQYLKDTGTYLNFLLDFTDYLNFLRLLKWFHWMNHLQESFVFFSCMLKQNFPRRKSNKKKSFTIENKTCWFFMSVFCRPVRKFQPEILYFLLSGI